MSWNQFVNRFRRRKNPLSNQQQQNNQPSNPSTPASSGIRTATAATAYYSASQINQIMSWLPNYSDVMKNLKSPLETINTKEPLVGYRAWRVKKLDEKYYLQSTYKDTIWFPRKKLERGRPLEKVDMGYGMSASLPPNFDYSKGIHAVKEKHKLGELCVNYEQTRVCGEIYMWGEVTETQYGYLAQYAYPKELWVMTDMDPTIMMELEDNYGVPVKTSEALEMAYKASVDYNKKLETLEEELNYMRPSSMSNPMGSTKTFEYIKHLEKQLHEQARLLEEMKIQNLIKYGECRL
jgi:hypothetical protein